MLLGHCKIQWWAAATTTTTTILLGLQLKAD
jgi:hypothetical protein